MFDNFKEFEREMRAYQIFRSKYTNFSKITTDKGFRFVQIFCWFLSLLINLVYLEEIRFQDFKFYIDDGYLQYTMIIGTISLIVISSFMGICWFVTNYRIVWINQMHRFKQKNPYKNPNSVINFILVSIFRSILL